jgi:hypothetical protein
LNFAEYFGSNRTPNEIHHPREHRPVYDKTSQAIQAWRFGDLSRLFKFSMNRENLLESP